MLLLVQCGVSDWPVSSWAPAFQSDPLLVAAGAGVVYAPDVVLDSEQGAFAQANIHYLAMVTIAVVAAAAASEDDDYVASSCSLFLL